MPRHHMIDNVKVPFTAEEETARDVEEAQALAEKPMEDWLRKIAGTDSGMPRYLEDHITDDHDGVASNEFLQNKYDAKIKLREERL